MEATIVCKNIHRVAVSAQSQCDDRRRRRSDDGRDGSVLAVLLVVVAIDTDRFSAPEDARTATKDDVRDLTLGSPARRYFANDGVILLLHLARPRAGLEDHSSAYLTDSGTRKFLVAIVKRASSITNRQSPNAMS